MFLSLFPEFAASAISSFNLHFQETFFVSAEGRRRRNLNVHLSISIFRRLSLFPGRLSKSKISSSANFQSPFSGDFLCFPVQQPFCRRRAVRFQSPFSGDFLCFDAGGDTGERSYGVLLSISIFRRLSLFRFIALAYALVVINLSISIFRRLSLFRYLS